MDHIDWTIDKGEVSVIRHAVLRDSSVSTGALLTGLAFNSAGLSIVRIMAGEAAITNVTIEDIATIGTYSSPSSSPGPNIRFKETTKTGLYEFQFHDDWFVHAAGDLMTIVVDGATNLRPLEISVQLTPAGKFYTANATKTDLFRVVKNQTGGARILFGMTSAGVAQTGKTPAVTLVKDTAAPVAASGGVTETGGGWYRVELTQPEINFDDIGFKATAAGCDDLLFSFKPN